MCLGENRRFLYNCTFSLVHDAVVTQILVQRVRWKDLNETLLLSPKPQKEQKPVSYFCSISYLFWQQPGNPLAILSPTSY
jgi:hypothetical protein